MIDRIFPSRWRSFKTADPPKHIPGSRLRFPFRSVHHNVPETVQMPLSSAAVSGLSSSICRFPYVLIRAGSAIFKAVSSPGTNCFLGYESESGAVKEKTTSSATPRITDLMTTGYARSCASARGFERNPGISTTIASSIADTRVRASQLPSFPPAKEAQQQRQ